jgi:hypothetical protein
LDKKIQQHGIKNSNEAEHSIGTLKKSGEKLHHELRIPHTAHDAKYL